MGSEQLLLSSLTEPQFNRCVAVWGGQGVILALGVNKKIVGAGVFTISLDWQWLCSCFGRQINLHICRDNVVI